jgi:fido (protein-threonine AMPylation protein)
VTGTTGADPYSEPATGVLRNRLGITSADELAQAEAALSASRLIDLERRRLIGSYDLDHLRGFHRIILGDVYDWAGELRTVSIAKGSVFCLPQHLASSAADIFGTPGTTSTGSAWTRPQHHRQRRRASRRPRAAARHARPARRPAPPGRTVRPDWRPCCMTPP